MKKRIVSILFIVVFCLSISINTAFAGTITSGTASTEKEITVAVTMEKFTLGEGYIIEPVLVTVPNGVQASIVITDLIKKKYAEVKDPFRMTGSIKNAFYLASVYDPNQKNLKIPQYILDVIGDKIDYSAANGDYLGEFNYYTMSGWMYCVGKPEKTGDASFPAVGAANWPMQDRQVMRWQFTLYGYGADLNADNSEWGSKSIVKSGDKDALIWKVAELNGTEDKVKLNANTEYMKAMDVLVDASATQEIIDKSLENLMSKYPDKEQTDKDHPNKIQPDKVQYEDIANHWAKQFIVELSQQGIVNGSSKTTFSPNKNITRAEFVQILFNMNKSDDKFTINEENVKFQDVKKGAWYANAVEWAAASGIASGAKNGDGTVVFNPKKNISRQDMAVMIKNYIEKVEKQEIVEKNQAVTFADEAKIASYAKESVSTMQKAGIIKGSKSKNGSFIFAPKANATRAEATKMIYQLAK